MSAAFAIVRENALYYSFVFNLNISRSRFESAIDVTSANAWTSFLVRGLHQARRGCPKQDKYNDDLDVIPFDKHSHDLV
jgi:hypothetical protein